MTNQDQYKVAIDILRCHLGLSFEEACEQLGINAEGESITIDEQKADLPIGLTFDLNK